MTELNIAQLVSPSFVLSCIMNGVPAFFWLVRPTGTSEGLEHQSTALSTRAVDGYRMYSGGSASAIDPKISPTLP